ncbi:hypothetical protein Glove_46g155 [Diversispora epigaea]|uniref:Uncharacterized protein n=1 Tax=Diversispora epigaea TaxID=1348612 RepID=A0A397JQK9_9GLOM|nr:hypothetical protein Glove_46g155 [Diversispora epigaea]
MTKKGFRDIGFALGPAKTLTKFISDIKEQKLQFFSSYKTLEELKNILRKYKVNGEDITFFEEIDDNDKALKQCMKEITLRLSNLETMQDNTSGRVDYSIEGYKDLIYIAERWKTS